MTAERVERRLTVIVSADVVGYSRLTEADEAGTRAALNAHRNELIDPKLAEHHGRLVSTAGDSLLVEFPSVVGAVQCAIEVQRGMKERNRDVPDDRRIVFRIGINLGDIIVEGDDIHGEGVNVAARLQTLAEPGGICISGDSYRQVEGKVDVGFADLGDQTVKNITKPIRAYRVLLEPEAASKIVGRKGAKKSPLPKRWRWAIPAAAAAVEANMAFPLPEKSSIVVLPFDDLSDEQGGTLIVEALSRSVTTALSQTANLFVAAHNISASTASNMPVRRVAEELGVRYVLKGSAQRSGRDLRVTAQLIDAVKGRYVWADSYDGEIEDLFVLQDHITRSVVEELQVELTTGEQARVFRRGTESVEAYELLLRCRESLFSWTPEGVRKALELCQAVIELDQNYAAAYTGLSAVIHDHATDFGLSEDPEASLATALAHAERAVEIDDTVGFSHVWLGFLLAEKGEFEAALVHGKRAVELEPNHGDTTRIYSWILMMAGRPAEAVEWAELAFRLEPVTNPYQLVALAEAYRRAGRYDDMIPISELRLARDPPALVAIDAHRQLAYVQTKLGNQQKASEQVAEILALDPDASLQDGYLDDDYRAILRTAGLPEHPPLPLPDKPSIAVLPFDNLSDDPEQEWFADGMTDDLITDLSKVPGLFVIARNSSFTYKGKAVDVKAVGRELGVKHVLEGSVRRMGDQVRINAQLIDATTGGHVWAERYDGTMNDVFALQDRVTRQVVTTLAANLAPDRQVQSRPLETESIEAYEAFLKGLQHYRNWTPDDAGEASRWFEKAIELDPEYWRVYAALAKTYGDADIYLWFSSVGMRGTALAPISVVQQCWHEGHGPCTHSSIK